MIEVEVGANDVTLRALYEFVARSDEELSFEKGDRLLLVQELFVNFLVHSKPKQFSLKL